MHAVIETLQYLSDANSVGMSEEERLLIVHAISANPQLGDLMPGTGGARKVRFPAAGKGKRGGYRVVHYFGGADVPVFLLAVIKKGERADLSQGEKNELKKELAGLATDYRMSVRKKTETLHRRRR